MMKECPICNTKYDDAQNFCVKDGHKLRTKPSSAQQSHHFLPEESQYSGGKLKRKKEDLLKKIFLGVVLLGLCLIMLNQHILNAASYLRVEPESVIFAKCGGKLTLDIDYDGYFWKVNHAPAWVNFAKKENQLTLKVNPNYSKDSRKGSITVQSGKCLAQVFITQNKNATFIQPSLAKIHFHKDGGTKAVYVRTDGIQWNTEYPSYCNLTTNSDTIVIKMPHNTGYSRTGKITIKEDNVRASISFSQGGKCINCLGDGYRSCTICAGLGGSTYGFYYFTCSFCQGTGKIKCSKCSGSGFID